MPTEYKYDVQQCSVIDKELLTEFRKKRSEWLDWLERDEYHNIWGQIRSMMWNDAVYRSLNEAQHFASEENPTAAINDMLVEFLARGYVSTQVLDICKITDRSKDNPEKGVISLRRLLDDIKNHCNLLTRENFVSYDGLPYDYEAAEQSYMNSLTPEEKITPHWVHKKGPQAGGASRIMHSAFDELSGITAENRKPTDLIHEDVFKTVESLFEEPILEKLRTHRNKFIGHAADKRSREIKPLDELGLWLDEIEQAQRIVIQIATAIGFFYDTALGDVVPTAQFDVFENLDKPIIPAGKMDQINDWW
jgi:hypothetical protein